ncbi:MAG: hypothetical protein KDD50_10665, partial [Bdellovibrionales bacterium]|nr:hypothetical protein [Bdellovibrionales bacterium]
MVKTFSFFIRFVVCLIIIPEFSWAASVALPVSSKIIGKPSEDLISPQGKHWDAGSATAWAKQGGDLSSLNPLPSKFWQDKKYALLDPSSGLPLPLLQERSLSYPEDGQIVLFKDFDNKAPFTFYAKVQNQKTGQYYRMAMSRYTQPMLLRSALMRKLGYFIPAPKYYEKLRVKFESKDQMERFLQRAQNESGSDFETRDWIGARDDQSFILTIESSTLEYTLPVYSNLNWGISLNDKNARQSSLIELMSRQRAYRAMIVPFVVTNIPESLG